MWHPMLARFTDIHYKSVPDSLTLAARLRLQRTGISEATPSGPASSSCCSLPSLSSSTHSCSHTSSTECSLAAAAADRKGLNCSSCCGCQAHGSRSRRAATGAVLDNCSRRKAAAGGPVPGGRWARWCSRCCCSSWRLLTTSACSGHRPGQHSRNQESRAGQMVSKVM